MKLSIFTVELINVIMLLSVDNQICSYNAINEFIVVGFETSLVAKLP